MSRRKLFFPIFIYVFMLVWLACSFDLSPSQEQMTTLSLYFNKPSYADTETFLATVWINNNSSEVLRNVNLNFEIKPREYPLSTGKKTSKPVFKGAYPQAELASGITRLEVSQDLTALKITEGVYPVSLNLVQRRKTLASLNSYLVVVNSRVSPPLLVALVWNVHEPAHFDPEGVYLDNKIAEECRQAPDNPGIHAVYNAALAKHALIQANINVSPVLLDQLRDISDGYELKRDSTLVKIEDTSPAATDARKTLRDYENLIRTGQLELLPAPFAYPYLPDLTDRGWTDDVMMQVEEGQQVVKNALNQKNMAEGIYPPGLALSRAAVPLLGKSKVKYVILGEQMIGLPEGTTLPLLEPVVLQEGRSKLLAFIVNGEVSRCMLEPAGNEAIVQKMTARLAALYLDQPEVQKIIVLASPTENWDPSPAFLETLYGAFEQTTWLKTTTLSSAAKSFPTAGKIVTAKSPILEESSKEKQFFQVLDRARQDRQFFSSLVSVDNSIASKLKRDLLVAEASDWPAEKDNVGQRLAENITQIVAGELGKVKVPQVQKITFTNDAGKVRVAFSNGTAYIINAEITLSGKNFSFPEGESMKVSLRPKENVFDFQIRTKKPGEYPLKVTLHKGKRVIAETVIKIRSTYFDRLTCAFGVFGLLIVILVAMRQLRQRQKTA